jgi:hypothetical protein
MTRTRKTPAAAVQDQPREALDLPMYRDCESGCLPVAAGAERYLALERTLSPDCVPTTIEEANQVAAHIANKWRILPMVTALFAATVRKRIWAGKEAEFNEWARLHLGLADAARVCHVVSVGELIADAATIVACNNGDGRANGGSVVARNNGLHAVLGALPYNTRIVLAKLERPRELLRFWELYGARVPESSREEVRAMVDEFRKVKPARPHGHGKSAAARLDPSELFDCLAAFDLVRILKSAGAISTGRAVGAFKAGLTVVDAQTRAGRYSSEELGELLTAINELAQIIVPAARAAGLVLNIVDGSEGSQPPA